jgi:hypothetical protein
MAKDVIDVPSTRLFVGQNAIAEGPTGQGVAPKDPSGDPAYELTSFGLDFSRDLASTAHLDRRGLKTGAFRLLREHFHTP